MTLKQDFQRGLIPNALTTIGVLLAPTAITLHYQGSLLAALIVYIFAWQIDFWDGWLARKLDQTSQIGAFFDPLADKIFTWCFIFYFWREIHIMVMVIVIAIGFALTILRIYKLSYGRSKKTDYNIMASLSGKIKTNIEKSAFVLLIFAQVLVYYHILGVGWIGYTSMLTNCLLLASLFFAGISLHHQIKQF